MIQPVRYSICATAAMAVAMLAVLHSAEAHNQEPPWLDAAQLDQGIYIAVDHARAIRAAKPLDIKVTVRNMAGEDDVIVESVRYLWRDGRVAEARRIDQTLPSRRGAYEQFKAAYAQMHDLAHRGEVERVRLLAKQCQNMLNELNSSVLTDRHHLSVETVQSLEQAELRMRIEIGLVEQGIRRIVRRDVEIPVLEALPDGTEAVRRQLYDVKTGSRRPLGASRPSMAGGDTSAWYAGDQHLHTTYSLDALVLEGTEEDVTDYAATAESMGFDWIIISDHSNVHATWEGTDYYTLEQFAAGTAQAAAYTAGHELLALYGEEMGAGQTGLFNLPAHYLAYPYASATTGFLENPSSGLVFGIANCESEQVIIDRINDAGGFGFIAHPFDSGTLAFAEWDFGAGATGWSGLEIWSDTNGEIKGTDDQAYSKWHDLLNAIPGPQLGQLADRPDFPNRFPVGLGNSDAHQPGLIGITFTYAWMPSFSREQVVNALMEGRCVASNGPLLFAELNGARIGEVAFLLDGDNDLILTLSTTAEQGAVGDYEVSVQVNGAVRTIIPPGGDPGYSITIDLAGLDLSSPDKFVTVRADSTDDQHHALTNPIWLQFVEAGDADADELITISDFAALGECMTGPEIERLATCDIMDFDRDRDVDLADFADFQNVFTGP